MRHRDRATADRNAWLLGDQQGPQSFWDTPLRRSARRLAHPRTVAAALHHLAGLLEATVPGEQALDAVASGTGPGRAADALTQAAHLARAGHSVPAALVRAQALPAAAAALVAVGDVTGDVPTALRRAADHTLTAHRTARTLRWALGAPALGATTLLAFAAVLFTVITPALVRNVPAAALPWHAQALLWVGRALPVVALLAALATVARRVRTAPTTTWLGRVAAAVTAPLPGARAADLLAQEATWASVAADLLSAGLPVPEVAVAAAVVTDRAHRTAAWSAGTSTAKDSAVLVAHLPECAGPGLRASVAAGQRSGALPQQLRTHAATATAAIDDHAAATAALTVPVTTAVSAAVLLLFCLGVLLPVVDLLH